MFDSIISCFSNVCFFLLNSSNLVAGIWSYHRTAGTVDDNFIIIQATRRERENEHDRTEKRLNLYLERTIESSSPLCFPLFFFGDDGFQNPLSSTSSLSLSQISPLLLSLSLLFLLLFVLTSVLVAAVAAPTQHNLDTFVSFTKIAFVCVVVVVDLARLGLNHRNVWG